MVRMLLTRLIWAAVVIWLLSQTAEIFTEDGSGFRGGHDKNGGASLPTVGQRKVIWRDGRRTHVFEDHACHDAAIAWLLAHAAWPYSMRLAR
jgi:hypothetical protein